MNKKNLIALPLLVLLVTGCKDKVKELYPGNAYASTNFVENYYDIWNEDLKTKVNNMFTYDMPFEGTLSGEQTGKFNVDADQKQAKEPTNPEESPVMSLKYIHIGDQMDPHNNNKLLDWYHDTPVEDKGIGYGPTKNLSNVDKSFAYGYLSKLYDGRIQCDGYYQKSRVQMNDKGFGVSFPKQLESAKYVAFALRGGTTCERPFGDNPVFITFNFSLYSYDFNTKTYTQHLYQMSHCPVITNSSGHTELVSFYFNDTDVPLPTNVTAMSLTYEIESAIYDNLTTNVDDYNKNKETKSLFALMLYEVLIPDSTWR